MTRSFLNIITADGRMCRLAELGFLADSPSFAENGVVFRTGDKYKRLDFDTGLISTADAVFGNRRTSPDGKYTLRLEFAAPPTDGRGYVQLILRDNKESTETVLTRFMGSERSLGAIPFSADSRSIVFFGYPERELG